LKVIDHLKDHQENKDLDKKLRSKLKDRWIVS